MSLSVAVDLGLVVFLTIVTATYFRERGSIETVLVVVLPLLFRRAAPIPVLVIVALGALLTQSSADLVDIAAVAIAAYTVGDLTNDRSISAAAALITAAALAFGFTAEGLNAGLSLVLPFVVIMPAWVVGTVVRGRRADAAIREAARQRALAEREAALEQTVAEQRRTIARELHDVVAHAVSVMVIQAGAARSVLHTAPDEAETALLAVESTGRDAMAELRRLLDVLADDDDGVVITPQAGIAQIETLVARVRDAGLPVELQIAGIPRELPRGMDVTVYRIVEEALTNALRYAGRARTVVHLAFAPTAVGIEVVDDGPGPVAAGADTPKRGLIGMRERAALFGGSVDAGPREGRGYAVHAWLLTGPSTRERPTT